MRAVPSLAFGILAGGALCSLAGCRDSAPAGAPVELAAARDTVRVEPAAVPATRSPATGTPPDVTTDPETLRRRERLRELVADDPYEALEWARSVRPVLPGLVEEALAAIAAAEPRPAIELALAAHADDRVRVVDRIVAATLEADSADLPPLADTALTWPSPAPEVLRLICASWVARNAWDALEWLAMRAPALAAVPEIVWLSTAEQAGKHDAAAAMAYANRVPRELRSDWIEFAAAGVAGADPPAAVDWVGRYYGDPAYGRSVAAVADAMAARDPRAAARLLAGADADSARYVNAAAKIGLEWARLDPVEAVDWSLTLEGRPGEVARDAAVGQWAKADAANAKRWVLGLEEGARRSELAAAAVLGMADIGAVDAELVRAAGSGAVQRIRLYERARARAPAGTAAAEFFRVYTTRR